MTIVGLRLLTLSDIITGNFKQRWQKQYVPAGLSTAAESAVDSEMLVLLVYFLLIVYLYEFNSLGPLDFLKSCRTEIQL